MKIAAYILLLFTSLYATSEKTGYKRMTLLFYHQKRSLPIANTIEFFWEQQKDFDILEITDKKLIQKISSYTSRLTTKEAGDFSVNGAMIRYSLKGREDTIYTDQFFTNWKIKGTFYKDETEQLEQILSGFLHKSE